MRNLAKKITRLRLSLGLRQNELAEKIGVPPSTVSKWESGKQNPAIENARKLAQISGVSVEDFMEENTPLSIPVGFGRKVSVIGAVQAGDWLAGEEWGADDRYEVLAPPLPAEWDGVPVHGLQVKGDSFNKVYPDGSIVYAVPLSYAPGSPHNGEIVVAVRTDLDGTREATLKEYVVEGGQKWLWPRSTSPEYQAPIQLTGGNKKTSEVRIISVVIGGYSLTPSAFRRGRPQ